MAEWDAPDPSFTVEQYRMPIEEMTVRRLVSNLELAAANVTMESYLDPVMSGMILDLKARLVGSGDGVASADLSVSVWHPTPTVRNVFKLWLATDLHGARLRPLRKVGLWLRDRVKYERKTRREVKTITYSTRLCPHIPISSPRNHHEFLLAARDDGEAL